MTIFLRGLPWIFLFCLLLGGCKKPGGVIEYWETGNSNFRIQVTAVRDEDIFPSMAGATYLFKSTSKSTGTVSEIMSFHHDNSIPIPRDNIRFLNDDTAYVFMESKYAVTTDAGQTWTVWDGSDQILAKGAIRYGLIRNIELSQTGQGKMTLRSDVSPGVLYTNNYGVTWVTHNFRDNGNLSN